LVAWSPDFQESIPAGGMALVCGSDSATRNALWIVRQAKYSVRAEVDQRHAITETIETNNLSTAELSARPQ